MRVGGDWETRESENAHIGWLHLTPLAIEHLQHPPSIMYCKMHDKK